MGQKPSKKRKQTVSDFQPPVSRLATEEEIALAASYLNQMSRRGYGDAAELNISSKQKASVARSAAINALGK
ncbi:hypothetical protein [Agrobacterium larrymoorei]|uniref:Uncharacterized protein n=1 Tax=Agrobacterium larrymoorei TaxID=160699 RepID=A0AAF0H557_9HYPH|nr:hypothetical protein [Agrobacterium larrymoorei]WHA39743.1 hypothetical protein CFBP5477_007715 [Agrobacterium larrymoorei]